MISRGHLPYLGVSGLGGLFVAGSTYGLAALSGDDGLGPAIARLVH